MSEILINEKDLKDMSKFFKESIIAVANTPCVDPVQAFKNEVIGKLFDDYVSVVNNRMKEHIDRLNDLEEEEKERLDLPTANKVRRIIDATQDDMLKKGEEKLKILKEKLKDADIDSKDLRPNISRGNHIDKDKLINVFLETASKDIAQKPAKKKVRRIEENKAENKSKKKRSRKP